MCIEFLGIPIPDALVYSFVYRLMYIYPIAIVAAVQLLLMRSKHLFFKIFLPILLGLYYRIYWFLCAIESYVWGKLDLFNNILDYELVLYEWKIAAFGILLGVFIHYMIKFCRKKQINTEIQHP